MQLDADHYEEEGKLAAIREEREYSYSDLCTISRDKLPNYEQKVSCSDPLVRHETAKFQFRELHSDLEL